MKENKRFTIFKAFLNLNGMLKSIEIVKYLVFIVQTFTLIILMMRNM